MPSCLFSRRFIIAFCWAASSIVATTAWAREPKIVIVWGSYGNGHKSAAEAIKASILAKNPKAEVVLKDAVDFMGGWKQELSRNIYEKLISTSPTLYDAFFNTYLHQGEHMRSVGNSPIAKQFDPRKEAEWLASEHPDVVIATFPHAAESLVRLRNMGMLPKEIPIAWQHTDYVDAKYFSKISSEIDMTFLPHPRLENAWTTKYSVPSAKVMTTGMAINPKMEKELSPEERMSFMKSQGLDPNVRTIVLMSGANGVGDFPKIVKSLDRSTTQKIQIIAICGKNQTNYDRLTKMRLSSKSVLKTMGFIDSELVANFVKSSDLLVTKAGGLSSTEAFVMGKPVVFLDNNGGQERYNIRLFEKLGVGRGIREESQVGKAADQLLSDPATLQAMHENELKFRDISHPEKIADWTLKNAEAMEAKYPDGMRIELPKKNRAVACFLNELENRN